jgi:hypothetical protein
MMMNNNENNIMENNENNNFDFYNYMGGMFNGTMRPPFTYNSFADYQMAEMMGYLGYNSMFDFNSANNSPPNEGNLSYAGEGTFGTAGYRPPYTYSSQAEYDAAMSGGYLGYMSMAMYLADTEARGEGGGGGSETATEGNDVLYTTGSVNSVGTKVMTPTSMDFDLGGGDDIIGGPTADLQGDDYIEGGSGNDQIWGGSGNDWLDGDGDNDTIYGGLGNDIILGGFGSDVIWGGPGQDLLAGGITTGDLAMVAAFSPSNPVFADGEAVQDTFVFVMGEGGSTMQADEIAGWEGGEDKIAFSSDGGSSFIANPFSNNFFGVGSHSLNAQYDAGQDVTMVFAGNMSETYFGVQGNVTFNDSDVTTVV